MAVLDLSPRGRARQEDPIFQQAPPPPQPSPAIPRQQQPPQVVNVPGLQPPAPMPSPTPQPPTNYQFNLGAFRDAFNRATAGRSGTLQEFLDVIFPELQRQFPDIELFGSKQDKIRLPTGGVVDAVLSAGLGGRGYAFQLDTGPSTFFDDPIGMFLGGTVDEVMHLLRQPRELSPELSEAFNLLRQFAQSGGTVGGPPDLNRLRQATTQRVGELRADPFSDTEEAAMRVAAFDALERSRNVAIQQVRERMAAQGHGPNSPTVEAAIQQVNSRFDALRAQNENALLTSMVDERQRRRSEAMDLEQQLAAAEQAAAALASQSALTSRGQSIGSAQALAALAQFMDAQRDPMQRIMALLTAAGIIPAYAQQQYENARGALE